MTREQEIELLRQYEAKNPNKYLRKFGKVTQTDASGQPSAWEYVKPEDAVLKKAFKYTSVLGVKVEVAPKEKVVIEQEFIEAPTSPIAEEVKPAPKKPGRKPKENV